MLCDFQETRLGEVNSLDEVQDICVNCLKKEEQKQVTKINTTCKQV